MPDTPRRARWWCAVVVLLAGATATGCDGAAQGPAPDVPISSAAQSSPPWTGELPPSFVRVPAGQRAIDALGLELLVPGDLAVDPPCPGKSVNRPASGLTYSIACVELEPPAVWLGSGQDLIGGRVVPAAPGPCVHRPILDGEAGCVVEDRDLDASTMRVVAIWTEHDVGVQLQVAKGQDAWAMRIINSAYWVPVDRNGCAANRSPVGLPVSGPGSGPGGVLPDDSTTVSVCWYSRNRLVASGFVDTSAGVRAIADPNGVINGPGIGEPPSYTPQDDAPQCADLDITEGVVVLAHRSGRPDSLPTAQLADCRGDQVWTDGTSSAAVGEPLASALRQQTGMLISHGYQVAPPEG